MSVVKRTQFKIRICTYTCGLGSRHRDENCEARIKQSFQIYVCGSDDLSKNHQNILLYFVYMVIRRFLNGTPISVFSAHTQTISIRLSIINRLSHTYVVLTLGFKI